MFRELTKEEVFGVIENNLETLKEAVNRYGYVAITRSVGDHHLEALVEVFHDYYSDPVKVTTRSNDNGWKLEKTVKEALKHFNVEYDCSPEAIYGVKG